MTDIVRTRGDTAKIKKQITVKSTGVAVDITGCSFLLTVDPDKAPTTNENNLFQLTGTIIDAEDGVVGFAITEEQADQLGKFFYDIQMTNTDFETLTIDSGKITFKQDITKN